MWNLFVKDKIVESYIVVAIDRALLKAKDHLWVRRDHDL
jgi:hypothetical protein